MGVCYITQGIKEWSYCGFCRAFYIRKECQVSDYLFKEDGKKIRFGPYLQDIIFKIYQLNLVQKTFLIQIAVKSLLWIWCNKYVWKTLLCKQEFDDHISNGSQKATLTFQTKRSRWHIKLYTFWWTLFKSLFQKFCSSPKLILKF